MTPNRSFHLSQNRLEGSLGDTSIDRLLSSCRQHLITGTISITTPFQAGLVELRAGGIERAELGDLTGDAAVRKLRRLGDGMYELTQRLPDLSGELGASAQGEGELSAVPLVKIMQLCENEALSCTITLVRDFDRAEVQYRAGEITEVSLNGERDDDAIVTAVGWTDGRFRITAPPLALDIDGWPSAKDPTVPFKIDQAAAMMPAARPAAQTGLPGVAAAAPRPSEPAPVAIAARTAEPARSKVPRLPSVAEPLLTADTDDDRFRWQLAVLALMTAAIIALWAGAMLYAN